MGSDDKAVITGFICRLCSRMNRFVVHIYGDEGVQMQLAHKINFYLPITVNPNDPLPKTVCLQCIDSLEAQHELMEQFKWARQRLAAAKSGALDDRGRQERRQSTALEDFQSDEPSTSYHLSSTSMPHTSTSSQANTGNSSMANPPSSTSSSSEIGLDSGSSV